MDFKELHLRFIEHLRGRIQCGELTERHLAHLTGISQPHIHNVLNGKRALSMDMADTILGILRIDLLDLVEPSEWADRRQGD